MCSFTSRDFSIYFSYKDQVCRLSHFAPDNSMKICTPSSHVDHFTRLQLEFVSTRARQSYIDDIRRQGRNDLHVRERCAVRLRRINIARLQSCAWEKIYYTVRFWEF